MSRLVKIEIEEGLFFWAEVDESENVPSISPSRDPNLPPGANPTGFVDDVQKSADVAKQTIKAVVAYVKDAFTDFSRPDELEVEFNLTLTGTTGIPILAQQSAQSSLKVTAKWVHVQRENAHAAPQGESVTP